MSSAGRLQPWRALAAPRHAGKQAGQGRPGLQGRDVVHCFERPVTMPCPALPAECAGAAGGAAAHSERAWRADHDGRAAPEARGAGSGGFPCAALCCAALRCAVLCCAGYDLTCPKPAGHLPHLSS